MSRITPAFLALALTALLPAGALAQSPGASEVAMDSTAAQQLSTAPGPGTWGASGTLGFQLKEGRVETRGYDLNLMLYRMTSGSILLRFDGELKRAEYQPQPGADLTTVDDTRFASFTVVPRLSETFSIIGIGSWRQDDPVGLDHRAMAQVGPYIQLTAGPRFHLAVAPLVGAGSQDNHASDSEGIVNFGGYQSLVWHPTNTSTIETYVTGHVDVEESDDYALDVNTSLEAMVTSHIGLKIYYQYDLEGIHPESRGAHQHTVGAGVTISYPGRGGGR